MKDVFEWIDGWNSRINLFRDHKYLQKLVFVFSLTMFVPWFALGFDSGVGMFEVWKHNWMIDYSAYGKSLHFSAFIIYGFLFYGLSRYSEKLEIEGSKNVLYSTFLVLLNVSVFELWYMTSFAHFQMHRNLVEWFLSDFWFLQQYVWILVLGILTVFAVWVESYVIEDNRVVGRRFRFQLNGKVFFLVWLTGCFVLLWVFYPLPVETVTLEDWTNSELFPQTHYAYANSEIYVPNDMLHLTNLIVKSLFAFTQFYIISRFKRVTN